MFVNYKEIKECFQLAHIPNYFKISEMQLSIPSYKWFVLQVFQRKCNPIIKDHDRETYFPIINDFTNANEFVFMFLCPCSWCWKQGYQFRSVSLEIAKTFRTNSKNKTKRNKFHLILNLSPFRIFQLNSTRNVPVSFHMFRSALEKLLNQIEPCSI